MTSRFIDPLVIEEVWHAGEACWAWRVREPMRYESARLGQTILVPAGFVTDGASVPRALPAAYALFGGTAWAPATVHDLAYQTHMLGGQDTADRVLEEAIVARGGYTHAHARAMYDGVRLGGSSSYESGLRRFTRLGNDTVLKGPILLPLGAEIPAWARG